VAVYVTPPIAVPAALIVLGLWQVLRGLWPKRQGQTPCCKACGCNLTGIERVRRPECGRELGAKAVVLGERVRRPRRNAPGLTLLLLAATPAAFAVRSFRKFNWYAHMPASSRIFPTERADDELSGKPWAELEARVQTRGMTRKDVSSFVDMCLRQLADHEKHT